jgi:hypothetical protein
MSTSIEKKSLEAHVELCAERYDGLNRRFDQVESRLDKLEIMVVEIKDCVHRLSSRQTDQWTHARDIIIGILFAAVTALTVRFIL